MQRGRLCAPPGGTVNPGAGETTDPREAGDAGQNVPSPGYFPRLLSAAAHVSHLASDGALEHFNLNRSRFSLLGLLAGGPSDETALGAGASLAPDALRTELHALQDLGYAAPRSSGIWAVTDAGLQAMQDARVAEAEITLDVEDSQELRTALRSLITSLREDPPGRTPGTRP